MTIEVEHHVALAPKTSLRLGGPAQHYVLAPDEATLIGALRWADAHDHDVLLLGGGSNLLVADEGWPGLVLHVGLRGIEQLDDGPTVRIRVAAGHPWDAVVSHCVAKNWAGIECLSGIPGSSGATPIQNVGAYGCEISEVVTAVHVWDRKAGERRTLAPEQCGFGYRQSAFKRDPGAVVVLAIDLRLRAGGEPVVRYAELARSLAERAGDRPPTVAQVRQQVLALRRRKSMVIDPNDDRDPNRRSAGSFFTNPVVSAELARRVEEVARGCGVLAADARMPQYATDDGRVKIPAAWLIEAAGFSKGQREGAVGISSAHALALVHHGGGTAAELVAFARRVSGGVWERFGVELRPEPVLVGVRW